MEESTTGAVREPAVAAAGPISYAIFRVARLHRMLAGQLLRETGLYPGQELVMMHLWDTGPQRQADLVQLLDSDAATVTRSVQRLERAGFVRRSPSPTDGRVTIVSPTTASQPLRRAVEQVWGRLEELTLSGFDQHARSTTAESLGALERSLLTATALRGRAAEPPGEDGGRPEASDQQSHLDGS